MVSQSDNAGQMVRFDASEAKRSPTALPDDLHCALIDDTAAQRPLVEAYIAERFAGQFGAQVKVFLPWILTLTHAQRPAAAVGLQPAGGHKLFLEQYLDQPIESQISAAYQQPVDRNHVVEIGNLVATRSGSSYLLFAAMTVVLHEAGFQWLMFTATEQVQTIVRKMQFEPLPLCPADPTRLADGARDWGSYYANRPLVMAGQLAQAYRILQHSNTLLAVLEPFWRQLKTAGRALAEAKHGR